MRIVISGTVGVGKSTISQELVDRLNTKGYNVTFLGEETANSIYLDYYYRFPQEWAFIAQLDFLMARFKQWIINEKSREETQDPKAITIYDRHFLDDYVFAELHTIKENISMFNSITYQVIYKELIEKMTRMDAKPDYFILLTADLTTIIDRLESRGREEEKKVDAAYWKVLYHNYYTRPMFQNHFQQNSKKCVKLDTVSKSPSQIVEEIVEIIEK